jgi:choline dehydrogenase-like flavoprotein
MTVVVAGSGLAGVFAALGALEQGLRVLMIDPGNTLDHDTLQLKKLLSEIPHDAWTDAQREMLKYGAQRSSPSLSEKRLFASNFALDQHPERMRAINCNIMHSRAVGGLSNLWGRGIEPPYQGEFEHWPKADEFVQAMRRVLKWIPLAAERDNLAEVLPLYTDRYAPHQITDGAASLLSNWERNKESLNRAGIHFGKTRLSLKDCRYCGLCFYGCVYDAMFDSTAVLDRLKQFDHFTYRSGIELCRYQDTAEGVSLTLKTSDGKEELLSARNLILATGSASTTEIVMASAGIESLTMKNSEMLKFLFISLKGKQTDQAYHSLSQLTIAIKHKKLSNKAMVMHMFGKNTLIAEVVHRATPRLLHKALSRLLEHVFIGMCFLHSDDSSAIHVKHREGVAEFRGGSVLAGWWVYVRLLIYFIRHIRELGLLPIPFIGGVTKPGSSVHTGASLAVDANGKLSNHQHVYAADASALPEIPAGSFTLSIMANAYLTGSSVGKL